MELNRFTAIRNKAWTSTLLLRLTCADASLDGQVANTAA